MALRAFGLAQQQLALGGRSQDRGAELVEPLASVGMREPPSVARRMRAHSVSSTAFLPATSAQPMAAWWRSHGSSGRVTVAKRSRGPYWRNAAESRRQQTSSKNAGGGLFCGGRIPSPPLLSPMRMVSAAAAGRWETWTATCRRQGLAVQMLRLPRAQGGALDPCQRLPAL